MPAPKRLDVSRRLNTKSFLDGLYNSDVGNGVLDFQSVSEAMGERYKEIFSMKMDRRISCTELNSLPFATRRDGIEAFIATTFLSSGHLLREQFIRCFKVSDEDTKKSVAIELKLTSQYFATLARVGRPNRLIPVLFSAVGELSPPMGSDRGIYRDFNLAQSGGSGFIVTPNPHVALLDMLPAITLLRDTPAKANLFAHVMYHLLDSLFGALEQLCDQNIIHGNIDLNSIFLMDEFGSFALGAFEMARESCMPANAAAPTNSFLPPEDVLLEHTENDFSALDLYRVGRTLEWILGQDIRSRFQSEGECWDFIEKDFNNRIQLELPEDFGALLRQRVEACTDFRSLLNLIVAQACKIDPRERINKIEIKQFFYGALRGMLPVLSPTEALELEEFYRAPQSYKVGIEFFEIKDEEQSCANVSLSGATLSRSTDHSSDLPASLLASRQPRMFHFGVRRKALTVAATDSSEHSHSPNQQTFKPA